MIFSSDKPIIARKAHVGLAGLFRFEAVNARTGRRRVLRDWFPNLILNNGLNAMGNTTTVLARCMVGTGTSTPIVTQSQLDTRIASTTNIVSATHGVDLTDNYAWRRAIYRFAEGVAAGNLTEVGVGNSDTSCFSRALTLDGGGSPTPVTVLGDEYLDVLYELRLYPKITDTLATINVNGTDHDTILRVSDFSQWGSTSYFRFQNSTNGMQVTGVVSNPTLRGTGALGDYTVAAGGTGIGTGTYAPVAYVNNSYEIVSRATFSVAQGSADVYNLEMFQGGIGKWKASFNPPIPKRNTNTMTFDLKLSWARKTL